MSNMTQAGIRQLLNNPGSLTEQVLAYMTGAGQQISNDKTLGYASLYHAKPVTAEITTFFSGAVPSTGAAGKTNLTSFQTPVGSCALIWGIRWWYSTDVADSDACTWVNPTATLVGSQTEIDCSINGNSQFQKLDLTETWETTAASNGYAMVQLIQPLVWYGQTELEIISRYSGAIPANLKLKYNLVGFYLY